MNTINNVKLELLRQGPAHNQLLSPLTPYLALCGEEGPVTINIPFEHRQLLNRLSRLRYVTTDGEIPPHQREAEVRELGEIIGKILGSIPTFISELAHARCGGGMIHLRLSLSAFELGMLPYELAIGSDGMPASGSPLFLQTVTPITVTREVRHGQPLPVNWDVEKPRILFAFASPGNLPTVPYEAHLSALRRAIEPWVKWQPTPQGRVNEVKQLLDVIPDATIEKIAEACAKIDYSYVHILAHGAPFDHEGEQRYGVALCSGANPAAADIVDGERLALVLTTKDRTGGTRHRPTVVSLATCDSGAVNSVLVPGGSIAHALHYGGIPWVFASQFPLWMRASSLAVEMLYSGILQGNDPRMVLYELRQRLRTQCSDTHDWSSIVAYSSVPLDFGHQVAMFRYRQLKSRLYLKLDILDDYLDGKEISAILPPVYQDMKSLYRSIREDQERWLNSMDQRATGKERAELLGITAAAEKRIGLCLEKEAREQSDLAPKPNAQDAAHVSAYKKSRDLYKLAMELEPENHWVLTQFLSLQAILHPSASPISLSKEWGETWSAARHYSKWSLRNKSGRDKAWALGTLAELEMLGVVYASLVAPSYKDKARDSILQCCQQIVEIMGQDSFEVRSTQLQFQRYARAITWQREGWQELAEAALEGLGVR